MVIPPNKKMIRMDYADVIYKTEREKLNAIVEEIVDLNKRGQPVLVGTISIEKSETLLLKPHPFSLCHTSLGGMTITSRLYILLNSEASVSAVPVIPANL